MFLIMLPPSITIFWLLFWSFLPLYFVRIVLEALSFFFCVSLLCISLLLLAFELTFVSVFDFSLVFGFLLSLRIALSLSFEFTRSPFTGGLSALTTTVLVERYAEVSTFFAKSSLSYLQRNAISSWKKVSFTRSWFFRMFISDFKFDVNRS